MIKNNGLIKIKQGSMQHKSNNRLLVIFVKTDG